jgi:hypothetical protein
MIALRRAVGSGESRNEGFPLRCGSVIDVVFVVARCLAAPDRGIGKAEGMRLVPPR